MKRIETKFSVAIPDRYQENYSINRKIIPEGPADLAFELIRQWGRTSIMPDPANDETKTPSSTWVLMPPEELITRAFNVAEAFYAEVQKRGMFIELDYTETPKDK